MPKILPDNISFTNPRARTKSAEVAIASFAEQGLGRRDTDQAVVRCTPEKL